MNEHWLMRTLPLLLVGIAVVANQANAQSESGKMESKILQQEEPRGYWNWSARTLGGRQFWSDVRCVGGWKIQRNSATGHHRLLDTQSVRQAWGNRAHCDRELDRKIVAGEVKPYQGKIVIILHGLMRSSISMQSVADYLESKGGYETILFQYASSREPVEVHARDLRSVIEGLGADVTEINFVGHSLGNLVVRHYLDDIKQMGRSPDPRFGRMVMLGPPNQGSKMARMVKNNFAFKTVAGESGGQLASGWKLLEPRLAIPEFEFGIIAGGQMDESDFSNFILQGKDDFTVALEEAKLAGAHDLFVQPLFHSSMMNQAEVHEAMLNFLKNGYFVSADQRNPIPKDWQPAVESKDPSDGQSPPANQSSSGGQR